MKKAIIYTLNGNYNFGNKLQNYALLTYISKYGLKVRTCWSNMPKSFILKEIIKYIFPIKNEWKREKKFIKFNKFLKREFVSINHGDRIYHIVGSDQVWNPNYNVNFDYLLMDYKQKNKIAYAASFGVDKLDEQYKTIYKKWLNDFDYISVREEEGRRIINELIENDSVDVLIDPTLLLNSTEWNNVLKKPSYKTPTKYILKYFLGSVSSQIDDEITRVAKENDCAIIDILNKDDDFYLSGPSEFLWLEQNAFLICTDSFHSCVFAFIYNRPFVVFKRNDKKTSNMYSRIETLLKKFKLFDREYNGEFISSQNIRHDYSNSYVLLENERKKSDLYLKKSLDLSGDSYER